MKKPPTEAPVNRAPMETAQMMVTRLNMVAVVVVVVVLGSAGGAISRGMMAGDGIVAEGNQGVRRKRGRMGG